ncbi:MULTISPECIES: hypothetical protein [unclassified Streptomyces]|uniref:hypothetical protein n=1 Tax=unclassified Streptomyces TaxID=2593676 RepID=UPI001CB722B3|nr:MULTISPECIES: hypothetical protein [unclassified Streptomyces]
MDVTTHLALPHVDEHTTVVPAPADAVWRELGKVLDHSFGHGRAGAVARLLGCPDHTPSGPRPLAEGSTLTGFRVAAATPNRELLLIGRHHFSTYALILRLDEAAPGRTRLRAETRARFPGPAGALYGRLVIGTGGHALFTRHLLRTVEKRAPKGRGAVTYAAPPRGREQPPPPRRQNPT